MMKMNIQQPTKTIPNMKNMNISPLRRYTTYGPHSTNICSRSCIHLVRMPPWASCQCTRNKSK